MQYRSTSCLCLWVEIYKSNRSLATLCGGPELASLLTWADTYSRGGGKCWFCLSSPNLRGV